MRSVATGFRLVEIQLATPSCFALTRFAGLTDSLPRSRMPSEALAKEGGLRICPAWFELKQDEPS
jgi:hypothetical protein